LGTLKEHPWGTHWEPDGNLKGTCWEQREKKRPEGGVEVDGKWDKAGRHHAGRFTPGNMASESNKQNVPGFLFLRKFCIRMYISLSLSLSRAIRHLSSAWVIYKKILYVA